MGREGRTTQENCESIHTHTHTQVSHTEMLPQLWTALHSFHLNSPSHSLSHLQCFLNGRVDVRGPPAACLRLGVSLALEAAICDISSCLIVAINSNSTK